MNWITDYGREVEPPEDGEYLVVRLRGGLSTRPSIEIMNFSYREWEDDHVVAYMPLPELPLEVCEDFGSLLREKNKC